MVPLGDVPFLFPIIFYLFIHHHDAERVRNQLGTVNPTVLKIGGTSGVTIVNTRVDFLLVWILCLLRKLKKCVVWAIADAAIEKKKW